MVSRAEERTAQANILRGAEAGTYIDRPHYRADTEAFAKFAFGRAGYDARFFADYSIFPD